MEREYLAPAPSGLRRALGRLLALGGDYRTPEAHAAFRAAIADQPPHAVCVSVGGGPQRVHPALLNLNLGPYPNVDVAGTAYGLPFRDGSVDAVYCEAVLEHLELPEQAVAEMFRVLRPGGQVFAATPFLQAFHGYPSHFQNYTLVGHRRLFERAGFEVLSAGPCVGPVFAMTDLGANFLRRYLPGGKILSLAWRLAAVALRPLDLWFRKHPDAYVLASTTYVHARKPIQSQEAPLGALAEAPVDPGSNGGLTPAPGSGAAAGTAR
jgi:SAM-dependent methyltransferase